MSWPLFWLTLVTASRLILCPALWWWLWRRSGAPVLAARLLVIGWFVVSDYCDGDWARARGLDRAWGGWLDHSADWVFALTVIVLGIRDSPFARRRRRGP